MITITIPGAPTGKGRARSFIKKTGGIGHYTPAKTRDKETTVAWWAAIAMRGRKPLGGPVAMTMDARIAVPKSWSKQDTADALAGRIFPTGKPDLDNIEKLCLDGMNGIVWIDDAQVVTVIKAKRYAARAEVVITITEQLPECCIGG